jgi:hypothetical protein
MRILICLAACSVLTNPTAAQLTDLQPGRNFPTSVNAFGNGRTENIDVGDIDNDGDLDVGVANGGDGAVQANRIYINNGLLQGATKGTFSDGTATRFAGIPNDTSRDIEFADFDNDYDLDIYISNRGNSINLGEVSRAYINQGGAQTGMIGYFSEGTGSFWGNLVSVPLSKEDGTQDGQGPWRDHSCDCDFGDLDDDGDLDLYHSSYGLNINGTEDSRIFLNDGTGTFDELSPWANPGADIKLHTLDIDLADFDGDYDLDVFASSRNSQARVYRNNLDLSTGSWAGSPFTDITQTALINTGALFTGGSNYEAEFADLDGDGDFDVWAKNYNGFTDRILRNNGNMTFTQMNSWIAGDPTVDENEVDFCDYDGDGDLDVMMANFSGTNSVYQGGVAQGLQVYTRNGSPGAPWQETPINFNGGTTLDGECADMDCDGDPDFLLAQDSNGNNNYWENILGVPDTHAPSLERWTNQGNKANGSDTVIRAQVRDNNNYYNIDYYDVELLYTLSTGPLTCEQMVSQRGQQFRGVIPGGISGSTNGTVVYQVRVTDDAGNVTTSPTRTFNQTAPGSSLWVNIGCGTFGACVRIPYLTISGTQIDTELVKIQLTDCRPNVPALFWVSLNPTFFDAVGGTIYAFPHDVSLVFNTGNAGGLHAELPWVAGPPGTDHYWQVIVLDDTNPSGFALSNGVHGKQP